MTTLQRKVVWIAAALALMMVLFPPYDVVSHESSLRTDFNSADYATVAYKPLWYDGNYERSKRGSLDIYGGTFGFTEEVSYKATLSPGLLALQLVGLFGLTALALLMLRPGTATQHSAPVPPPPAAKPKSPQPKAKQTDFAHHSVPGNEDFLF